MSSNELKPMIPPFDQTTHIRSPEIDSALVISINELRKMLEDDDLFKAYSAWCTNRTLQRFLIARQYNVRASADLIKAALKWRNTRIPVEGIESLDGWEIKMSKESETGKIYISGLDSWGRPILIFDNSVQNTTSVDDQLRFLAWNLEYATKLMSNHVDKYVVFMNLEIFSLFNSPPLSAIKESIFMLCNGYPETLGHCICYKPPYVFKSVFNAVKSLIDPRTAAKMIFITGDVADGSKNDLLMRGIIGDDWKVMTGAGQPVLVAGSSPGYDHSKYWPASMSRLKDVLAAQQDAEFQQKKEQKEYQYKACSEISETDTLGSIERTNVLTKTHNENKFKDCVTDGFDFSQGDGNDKTMNGVTWPAMWDDDSEACGRCDKKFGLINRRHHCRKCGMCVCSACSKNKIILAHEVYCSLPQRVCESCFLLARTASSKGAGGKNTENTSASNPSVAGGGVDARGGGGGGDGGDDGGRAHPACDLASSEALHTVSRPSLFQRPVGVKIRISLQTIDDISEEVHLVVKLVLHFATSSADSSSSPSRDDVEVSVGDEDFLPISDFPEIESLSIPRLEILNTRQWEVAREDQVMLSKATGFIYVLRHYNVSIKETLELNRFPFDRQVVKFKFQSFDSKIQFQRLDAPVEDMPASLRHDTHWLGRDLLVDSEDDDWVLDWAESRVATVEGHLLYTASFGASRTSRYYVVNFALVMFMLVQSASFCAAIAPSDFGGRAGLAFTLLLTIISFKSSMADMMPKISYLTYLDCYNLMCIVVLTGVILENFLLCGIFTESIAEVVDAIVVAAAKGLTSIHTAGHNAGAVVADMVSRITGCSSGNFDSTVDCLKSFVGATDVDQLAVRLDACFFIWFSIFWILFHAVLFLAAEFGWFYDSWDRVKRQDARQQTQSVCSDLT